MAVTQFIAHDREVYDVAWLPNSTVIFVSVGVDSSLHAFDLRSLEHSTILYETPPPKNQPPTGRPPSSPLLHITFKPGDPNYISTFHQDGSDIQILDMLMIIIFSVLRVLLSLPAFTRGPTAHGRRTSPQTCIVRLPRPHGEPPKQHPFKIAAEVPPSDGRFI
ncbi:hypothetical protein BGY98DRAFT_1038267 [Russula aff. rugulosa BPL654]|nr:hypothetical protein BGY98DRAFT_1038267 [Russula aff. rugulosa BPL654]